MSPGQPWSPGLGQEGQPSSRQPARLIGPHSQLDPQGSSRNLSFLPQQGSRDRVPEALHCLRLSQASRLKQLSGRSARPGNSLRTNVPGPQERPALLSWKRGEARDHFFSPPHSRAWDVAMEVWVWAPWSLLTVPSHSREAEPGTEQEGRQAGLESPHKAPQAKTLWSNRALIPPSLFHSVSLGESCPQASVSSSVKWE